MFELNRDILLYILIGMSAVLVVLVALIIRKRHNTKSAEDSKNEDVPKPTESETGPTDQKSIKETLKPDRKEAEVPKPPKGSDALTPSPKPDDAKKEPEIPKEEGDIPKPPGKDVSEPEKNPFPIEPGDMEGVDDAEIEQGLELDEAAEIAKKSKAGIIPPEPEASKEPEIPKPETEPQEEGKPDMGFEKIDDKLPIQKKVDKEETGAKSDEKDGEKKGGGILGRMKSKVIPVPKDNAGEPAPKPEKPTSAPSNESGSSEKIDTATITKSPKSFKGLTVEIEGDLKLSSKGADDLWYVLIDSKGTAVVRSKKEIPFIKAKILAKVDQTRLGQTYLDVIKADSV